MALNRATPLAAWPGAEGTAGTYSSTTKTKPRILPTDRRICIVPFLKYHSICQILPIGTL